VAALLVDEREPVQPAQDQARSAVARVFDGRPRCRLVGAALADATNAPPARSSAEIEADPRDGRRVLDRLEPELDRLVAVLERLGDEIEKHRRVLGHGAPSCPIRRTWSDDRPTSII